MPILHFFLGIYAHTTLLNTSHQSIRPSLPSRGGERLHFVRISFLPRRLIAQTYTWLPDPVHRSKRLTSHKYKQVDDGNKCLLNIYSGKKVVNETMKEAFYWNKRIILASQPSQPTPPPSNELNFQQKIWINCAKFSPRKKNHDKNRYEQK